MTTTFIDLCTAFCAQAHTPIPDLQPQDDGIIALNVVWRDVAVEFMARPPVDPDHAFVTFEMGTPDPTHVDFSRILQALLYANFASVRANPPMFGCDPQTGVIHLRWAVPLASTTGEQLNALIQQGINLVLEWRQDFFLPSAAAVSAAGPSAARAPVASFA